MSIDIGSSLGQTQIKLLAAQADIMAQGYRSMMSLKGEPEGEQMKAGVGIADVMCGMYASVSILAALRHKEQSGEGQHIDLALVDTQVA